MSLFPDKNKQFKKGDKKMKKSDILNIIINIFGFEHPYTITIASMIEKNVSFETIQKTAEGLLKMRKI